MSEKRTTSENITLALSMLLVLLMGTLIWALIASVQFVSEQNVQKAQFAQVNAWQAADPLTSNAGCSDPPCVSTAWSQHSITFPPCKFDEQGKLIEDKNCRYTKGQVQDCEWPYRLPVQIFVNVEEGVPWQSTANSKIIRLYNGGKDFVLVAEKENDFAQWLEKHKAEHVTLVVMTGACQ